MEGMGNPELKDFFKRIPELDTEYAIESMGGSEALYDKVLRQLILRIPANIQTMDWNLTADGNLLTFAIMAHGLRSSYRQIGHRKLARLAERLETNAKAGNILFCIEKYGEFKNELLYFYEQALPLLHDGTDKDMNADACESDIFLYRTAFECAKAAAEDYDTLAALEFLSSLSDYRFGGQADEALARALNALEAFRPLAALEHIEKLIGMCGTPSPQPDQEETNV